jgi:hypothetical protein
MLKNRLSSSEALLVTEIESSLGRIFDMDLNLILRHSEQLNPDDAAYLKNILNWMGSIKIESFGEINTQALIKILEFSFLSILHSNTRLQLLTDLLGLFWATTTRFL